MAVNSTLLTYPESDFTPQDFAIMLERVSMIKTGIMYGCNVTKRQDSNNSVNVSEGWVAVRGRLVKISEGTFTLTLPSSGSVNYYVLLTVDLGNTTRPSSVDLVTSIPSDESADFNLVNGKAYCMLASIVASITEITVSQDVRPQSSTVVYTTLKASDWSENTIKLYNNLITATSNQEIMPTIDITADQLKALQKANIQDNGQAGGYISLKAFGKQPTIDIPLRILFRGDQ